MSYKGCLFRTADLAFDVLSFLINLGDVVTDFIICYHWYQHKMWPFFWISVIIFFIAQVAYSVLFVVVYGNKYRPNGGGERFAVLCFIAIFPFAQLVPFIIWAQSYDFKFINKFFEWMGLEVHDNSYVDEQKDPLRNYIMKKFRVHGGFITEALVESVPQSILQMVAIVTHKDITVVDTVSLAMSILSVASRGFMLSYSIDRYTFVFNFICFVADVFGVFCIVSWLFFVPLGVSNTYTLSFLPGVQVHSLLSVIWFYKIVVVSGVAAVGCTLLLWTVAIEAYNSYKDSLRYNAHRDPEGWKDVCLIVGLFVFGTLLFAPGLVVVEAMTLSLLPLIVFQSIDNEHSRNAQPYNKLFNFFKQAKGSGDFETRVLVANRYFARAFMRQCGVKEQDNWTPSAANIYLLNDKSFLQARALITASDNFFALKASKEFKGVKGKHVLKSFCTQFGKEIKEMAQKNKAQAVGLVYAVTVCTPVFLLSSLYNLVYPVLLFALTPFPSIELLQLVLTGIIFFCFFLMLSLAYPVHRFRTCTTYLKLFSQYPSVHDATTIIDLYTTARVDRVRENVGRIAILAASTTATRPNPLSLHVVSLLPTICELAGFVDKHAIDVNLFVRSKIHANLENTLALELATAAAHDGENVALPGAVTALPSTSVVEAPASSSSSVGAGVAKAEGTSRPSCSVPVAPPLVTVLAAAHERPRAPSRLEESRGGAVGGPGDTLLNFSHSDEDPPAPVMRRQSSLLAALSHAIAPVLDLVDTVPVEALESSMLECEKEQEQAQHAHRDHAEGHHSPLAPTASPAFGRANSSSPDSQPQQISHPG